MSLNPKQEVLYRLELAKGYLDRARKAFALRDFADAVAQAQLSAENSAKAVISCFRIPSWSHDPSEELLEIARENQTKITQSLGEGFMKRITDLAEKTRVMAPEHGRSTYGDIERRIPPWRIYDRKDAEKGLDLAETAYKTASTFVNKWYALQPSDHQE